MLGPNISGLFFCLVVLFAFPLLLGAVAVLLASAEGASAGPHLRATRCLLAVATGAAVGCLVFVGTEFGGLYLALFANAGLAGCLLVIVPAALLGLWVAYRTAQAVAARLNRYRCRACQRRFRAPWPADVCPRCAEQREATAPDFAQRVRALFGRGSNE